MIEPEAPVLSSEEFTFLEWHVGGMPRRVKARRATRLETALGAFTPQWREEEPRKPVVRAVELYASGRVKSLPLAASVRVATPVGEIPAERLAFHENGSLARILPTDAPISAFWSEPDEAAHTPLLTLESPAGEIRARFLALAFHASDQNPVGPLRSLTLWPGDEAVVRTPLGELKARAGVAFHPDGAVASLEPGEPTEIETPLGPVTAYDPDPENIHGDVNSLCFTPGGELLRLTTVRDGVSFPGEDGAEVRIGPRLVEAMCDETLERELEPLTLTFRDGLVEVARGSVGPLGRLEPLAVPALADVRLLKDMMRPASLSLGYLCKEG